MQQNQVFMKINFIVPEFSTTVFLYQQSTMCVLIPFTFYFVFLCWIFLFTLAMPMAFKADRG